MALDVTSTGIAFTPQGGSNVNLLDDYEEGTWTLLIQGSATGGDEVSEFQVDRNAYTKIGNMVQIEFRVQENSNAPSNTNAFTVKGIPFASAATAWHAIGQYDNRCLKIIMALTKKTVTDKIETVKSPKGDWFDIQVRKVNQMPDMRRLLLM